MDDAPTNLREFYEAVTNHRGCGSEGRIDVITRIILAAINGDQRMTLREEKPDTKLSGSNEDDPPSE